MGQSQSNFQNRVNANCPECKKTGKLPNLAGRFHIINDTQCQCNGCNTVFDKKDFYTSIADLNIK